MVDHYVAVSDDLSHWLTEKVSIPARKVITIPNGVDSTRFSGIGRSKPGAAWEFFPIMSSWELWAAWTR